MFYTKRYGVSPNPATGLIFYFDFLYWKSIQIKALLGNECLNRKEPRDFAALLSLRRQAKHPGTNPDEDLRAAKT